MSSTYLEPRYDGLIDKGVDTSDIYGGDSNDIDLGYH